MSVSNDIPSIPVLDYSLVESPSTRPLFISQLQHALINVGFFYLSNVPIPAHVIDNMKSYIPRLFALPKEEKDRTAMLNSPHFLGYTGMGAELTKGAVDHKEQYDFGSEYETKWRVDNDTPIYWRVWGASQWPSESALPGFCKTTQIYISQMTLLSEALSVQVAEALNIPLTAFDKFFERGVQHRAKIIKYAVPEMDDQQGMGPHYDGGFLTILLQASNHRGLQVQTLAGNWIDVIPIPGTLVINVGKALEFVTQGVARATSHRVVIFKHPSSPTELDTPRYSIPFFQSIDLDIKLADHVIEIPPEILKLKELRGAVGETESINMAEIDQVTMGEAFLISRIKSHPDVAEVHYPELFKKYFPNGLGVNDTAENTTNT